MVNPCINGGDGFGNCYQRPSPSSNSTQDSEAPMAYSSLPKAAWAGIIIGAFWVGIIVAGLIFVGYKYDKTRKEKRRAEEGIEFNRSIRGSMYSAQACTPTPLLNRSPTHSNFNRSSVASPSPVRRPTSINFDPPSVVSPTPTPRPLTPLREQPTRLETIEEPRTPTRSSDDMYQALQSTTELTTPTKSQDNIQQVRDFC